MILGCHGLEWDVGDDEAPDDHQWLMRSIILEMAAFFGASVHFRSLETSHIIPLSPHFTGATARYR